MNDELNKGGFKPGQEPLSSGDKQPLTTMDVVVLAKLSDCFSTSDVHFMMFSGDRKYCWPCFGVRPQHNGSGYITPGERRHVLSTDVHKELVLAFYTPPKLTTASEGGIKLGITGTDAQVVNRLLLFSKNNRNICGANKCYLSIAFFGKFGIGIYDLKTAVNKAFDDVERTRHTPSGLREEVLAKIDNTIEEETKAWSIFFIKKLGMPLETIFNTNPELVDIFRNMVRGLTINRENIYNNESKKPFFPILYQGMLKKFAEKFIDKLQELNLINAHRATMLKLRAGSNINKYFDNMNKQITHYKQNKSLNYRLAYPSSVAEALIL